MPIEDHLKLSDEYLRRATNIETVQLNLSFQ